MIQHSASFSTTSKTNKNLKNRGRFDQQKITSPGVGDYLFTRLKNVSSQFKLACRQKCRSIDPEAGKCRLLCADFRAWGRRVTDACQLSSPWRRHRSVLASGSGKSRVLARTRTHTHTYARTHIHTFSSIYLQTHTDTPSSMYPSLPLTKPFSHMCAFTWMDACMHARTRT